MLYPAIRRQVDNLLIDFLVSIYKPGLECIFMHFYYFQNHCLLNLKPLTAPST